MGNSQSLFKKKKIVLITVKLREIQKSSTARDVIYSTMAWFLNHISSMTGSTDREFGFGQTVHTKFNIIITEYSRAHINTILTGGNKRKMVLMMIDSHIR